MTDVQDLAAYLASKSIAVHRAHGNEVTAHCFFCPDGDPKGKGKLYLNVESWLYDCKRCGEAGNRKTLLAHFGDEDSLEHVVGQDPMMRRRLLTEACHVAHQWLLANEPMLQYLLDRGLTAETITRKQYGYVPRNLGLSGELPSYIAGQAKVADLLAAGVITPHGKEFFNHALVLPYWSHGSVIQLRARPFLDGRYRTAAGDDARLYNADSLHGADQVVVTEGEFDADMLEQTLLDSGDRTLQGTAVVGLPGVNAWPDGFIEALASVRRVFIGFDPDDVGIKAAHKLKEELGQRARIIQLPPELPKADWNNYLKAHDPVENPHGGHTWRDVKQLLLEADLAGKRMFTIADAATKWSQQRAERPGLQLGWSSVDAVLRPGLKPGQVLIPLAKTGTGKTVWLSNVAHNLSDRRVLYVSLELTVAEVFEQMRRIHHFWFPKATAEQREADYARLRIVDQNRLGKGDLRDLISEYAEDVGDRPEVVMVDYLQYYARGFRGSGQYEKVSDAVMELKAVGKEDQVAIICPSQVSRNGEDGKPLTLDGARDSGVVEETADFVLSLFRPDQVTNADHSSQVQTGAFNAQLLKSRHGGKGRLFTFRLSNLSLAIAEVADRRAIHRIEQENGLYRGGTHYDDYRARSIASHSQPDLGEA